MISTVFIDGEAGTTGLGIARRLAASSGIQLRRLADADRKSPAARQEAMAQSNLVILCLPDDAARQAVALADQLGAQAPRILDASTAHRTTPGWIYGFSEIDSDQPGRIAQAGRVANPGCYATGAIALLHPLVAAGLLPPDLPLSINAVSGYSGGGNAMIADHDSTGGPAFELYALTLEHKHIPEIMAHTGLTRRPLFVPSVVHMRQGMLLSIPVHLDQMPSATTTATLHAALADHYAGAAQVRVAVRDDKVSLRADALNDTDLIELFVHGDDRHGHALLVARLDNLGKGASGAAVQNARLMLGLAA